MQFKSEAHFTDKLDVHGQMVLLARIGKFGLLITVIMYIDPVTEIKENRSRRGRRV